MRGFSTGFCPYRVSAHQSARYPQLATKKQLEGLESSLDRKLTDQTRQLKDYTDTQLELLRQDLQQGFADVDQKLDAIVELLDVRARVDKLETTVAQLLNRA